MAARAEIEREQKSEPPLTIVVGLAGHPPRDCKGKWCIFSEAGQRECALTREGSTYHVTEDGKVEEVIEVLEMRF
jgi:hypothetical protein